MRKRDSSEVRGAADQLIGAAQGVLDAWEQDEDGLDPELGAGGACQEVASAMAGALSEIGVEEVVEVFTEFDGDTSSWWRTLPMGSSGSTSRPAPMRPGRATSGESGTRSSSVLKTSSLIRSKGRSRTMSFVTAMRRRGIRSRFEPPLNA